MSTAPRSIILDTEAVLALSDPTHRTHRTMLAHLEVRNQRQRGRRMSIRVLVPVAVRVEAGWDRTAATAADINRISAAVDVELRRAGADRAVQLRQATEVSVVDAAVGQAAESPTSRTSTPAPRFGASPQAAFEEVLQAKDAWIAAAPRTWHRNPPPRYGPARYA